jgi:hypothetical protein
VSHVSPRLSERQRRAREAHEAALAKIAEEIKAGTLIVRQATAEERERFGIRAPSGRSSQPRRP